MITMLGEHRIDRNADSSANRPRDLAMARTEAQRLLQQLPCCASDTNNYCVPELFQKHLALKQA